MIPVADLIACAGIAVLFVMACAGLSGVVLAVRMIIEKASD